VANRGKAYGFGELAEQLRRSTVMIYGRGRGGGSGVIWSRDGSIVTNAHVVRGAHAEVELWDGRNLRAAVTVRDAVRDLALLRPINGLVAGADLNLPSASIADSSLVRAGELAIAIGNPLGFVGALSTGVIHALGPVRGLGQRTWLQADVRLAPGNSGGPLADARGRIIGINTMVAGRLALAIPSNTVQESLTQDFSADSRVDAWLGATLRLVQLPRSSAAANSLSASGLLLLEIEPESPASAASLLPGDILLGTQEGAFHSPMDLLRALQGTGPRLLRLEFLRGDYSHIRRVTVQLGTRRERNSVAA